MTNSLSLTDRATSADASTAMASLADLPAEVILDDLMPHLSRGDIHNLGLTCQRLFYLSCRVLKNEVCLDLGDGDLGSGKNKEVLDGIFKQKEIVKLQRQ